MENGTGRSYPSPTSEPMIPLVRCCPNTRCLAREVRVHQAPRASGMHRPLFASHLDINSTSYSAAVHNAAPNAVLQVLWRQDPWIAVPHATRSLSTACCCVVTISRHRLCQRRHQSGDECRATPSLGHCHSPALNSPVNKMSLISSSDRLPSALGAVLLVPARAGAPAGASVVFDGGWLALRGATVPVRS